jgi:peptidoglycan/xylan/chitin deacetylase (PgdA/CDA1 family)
LTVWLTEELWKVFLLLCKKYQLTGTFFLEGQNAAQDAKLVAVMDKDGVTFGNYSYLGISQGDRLSKEQLLTEFCKTQKVLKITAGKQVAVFKLDRTNYTPDLLKCAKASGLDFAVRSSVVVPVKNITDEASAAQFVATLKPGSIISVQLGIPTGIVFEQGKTDDRPAVDKKPNLALKEMPAEVDNVVEVVNWVCAALVKDGYTVVPVTAFKDTAVEGKPVKTVQSKKTAISSVLAWLEKSGNNLFGFSTAYAATAKKGTARKADLSAGVSDGYLEGLRQNNNGHLATEEKIIYTTEQAVPVTFTGFTRESSVDAVLAALKEINSTSTFFVSERELQRNKTSIDKIAAAGQELAIAVYPKPTEGFNEICRDVLRVRNTLQNQYGTTSYLVKQSSGAVSDLTKEAVSALNMHLIGADMNVVQTRHKDAQSPEEVYDNIFGKYVFSVGRGWLINIRTDFYTNPKLAADMLLYIKRKKIDNIAYNSYDDVYGKNPANDSGYSIKSIGSILADTSKRWTYPVPEKDYLPSTARKTVLTSDSEAALIATMQQRYIGAVDVDSADRMLGFKEADTEKFDKTGRIKTNKPVVFFTFDDWGTDAPINKLLYVFRKHHVPATFFVLTNNVPKNPNLLRAIAEAGHDIGSHTNLHKPMAIRDAKNKQIATMSYTDFYDDMDLSWKKLVSVVGDVSVNGKPALTHLFRPPTLAISKMGMEAVFQNGFTYSVSGSTSTADYSAKSLSQMIKRITDGLYYPEKSKRWCYFSYAYERPCTLYCSCFGLRFDG